MTSVRKVGKVTEFDMEALKKFSAADERRKDLREEQYQDLLLIAERILTNDNDTKKDEDENGGE